jgi:hypothetical protein
MLYSRTYSPIFSSESRFAIVTRCLMVPSLEPEVPQAKHLHALLPRGRRILKGYFPGITADMQAAGAEMLDIARDIAWLTAYGWGTRFRSEFEGLSSTRDLLDSIVRARLKQIPNVEVLQGCEVIGLVGELNGVEGVRLRLHGKMDFVDEIL